MKQVIQDNIYYLLDDNGKMLVKITLSDLPGNQVVIETDKEVYAGPISLLSFTPDGK